jgi:hypothetical protein
MRLGLRPGHTAKLRDPRLSFLPRWVRVRLTAPLLPRFCHGVRRARVSSGYLQLRGQLGSELRVSLVPVRGRRVLLHGFRERVSHSWIRPPLDLGDGEIAQLRDPGGGVLLLGHQKSTGAGTASSGASTCAPMPILSWMRFSMSLAMSGLSRRNLRAFSLPCPNWSPS